MKPALADKFKQINACLDELRERLQGAEDQAQSASQAREELQLKFWSQSRELHVLREQLDEFPEIKRMNEQFAAMSAEFEQRLRDILGYTRALAAAFHQ